MQLTKKKNTFIHLKGVGDSIVVVCSTVIIWQGPA